MRVKKTKDNAGPNWVEPSAFQSRFDRGTHPSVRVFFPLNLWPGKCRSSPMKIPSARSVATIRNDRPDRGDVIGGQWLLGGRARARCGSSSSSSSIDLIEKVGKFLATLMEPKRFSRTERSWRHCWPIRSIHRISLAPESRWRRFWPIRCLGSQRKANIHRMRLDDLYRSFIGFHTIMMSF